MMMQEEKKYAVSFLYKYFVNVAIESFQYLIYLFCVCVCVFFAAFDVLLLLYERTSKKKRKKKNSII